MTLSREAGQQCNACLAYDHCRAPVVLEITCGMRRALVLLGRSDHCRAPVVLKNLTWHEESSSGACEL
eukprot:1159989-Pelagomonas_calceolata.AAC.15